MPPLEEGATTGDAHRQRDVVHKDYDRKNGRDRWAYKCPNDISQQPRAVIEQEPFERLPPGEEGTCLRIYHALTKGNLADIPALQLDQYHFIDQVGRHAHDEPSQGRNRTDLLLLCGRLQGSRVLGTRKHGTDDTEYQSEGEEE